jgi:hypothetical protein
MSDTSKGRCLKTAVLQTGPSVDVMGSPTGNLLVEIYVTEGAKSRRTYLVLTPESAARLAAGIQRLARAPGDPPAPAQVPLNAEGAGSEGTDTPHAEAPAPSATTAPAEPGAISDDVEEGPD